MTSFDPEYLDEVKSKARDILHEDDLEVVRKAIASERQATADGLSDEEARAQADEAIENGIIRVLGFVMFDITTDPIEDLKQMGSESIAKLIAEEALCDSPNALNEVKSRLQSAAKQRENGTQR